MLAKDQSVQPSKMNECGPTKLNLDDFYANLQLFVNPHSEGRKTIKERPERIKEVNKKIEAFGARVLQQYAVPGSYDFVNIVEAPNNDAITGVSIELGSRGTVQITSMLANSIDDFLSMLKK